DAAAAFFVGAHEQREGALAEVPERLRGTAAFRADFFGSEGGVELRAEDAGALELGSGDGVLPWIVAHDSRKRAARAIRSLAVSWWPCPRRISATREGETRSRWASASAAASRFSRKGPPLRGALRGSDR